LHALYLEAFEPLRALAVARQVLHRQEFLDQMADPRVWKFVAWDQHGRIVGLSTLTRDLASVPWISPEYFAARYPEQTARHAVYYWGFSLTQSSTATHSGSDGTFFLMLAAIAEVVAADKGVCGYDICAVNNANMQLASQIERLGHRLAQVTFETIDTQTYYCATLA
jgi:hypothetical protein